MTLCPSLNEGARHGVQEVIVAGFHCSDSMQHYKYGIALFRGKCRESTLLKYACCCNERTVFSCVTRVIEMRCFLVFRCILKRLFSSCGIRLSYVSPATRCLISTLYCSTFYTKIKLGAVWILVLIFI